MTRITDPWLTNPATQLVCRALTDGGAQALFVGGCVRNALLETAVNDIDLTTDARPERVMELASAADLKAIPTGIDHGTVTIVSDHIPHEVTTFRRDVETDGRRAVVAYSDRIEDDAARRDFTMNAIYARPDGTVLDPLGGLADLYARRVRFIGEATDRIREDYLRSLRYFRFHAWYGDDDAGLDADALSAIASNLDGLAMLSRERVGHELLKLLAAPDPAPAVAGMRQTGALAAFLPGADDTGLAPLVALEQAAGVGPDPIRRLAAIAGEEATGTLRLSRAQINALSRLRAAVGTAQSPAELGYRLGAEPAWDVLLLRGALIEQPVNRQALLAAGQGAEAQFPLAARDLMPKFQGKELGARLSELERAWIDSGFSLDREALLGLPEG